MEPPDFLHSDDVLDLERLGIALEMGPRELEPTNEAERRVAAANARAVKAERRLRDRTELLGQVEHKLKTSFSVIAGWAEMLDESWDRLPDDQRREGVHAIRRRADDVVSHAHRLLEEVKSEITAVELESVSIDLAAVLRLSAGAYEGMSRRHTIVYAGPTEVPARLDPAALQQVLGQLLENAVKYSPDGGLITLGAGSEDAPGGGNVWITVIDEGIGLPADLDLFAPFQRGPIGAEIAGTGLGLYIVRNLVAAMNGAITATPNRAGGSTFRLTFPNPPTPPTPLDLTQ